MLGQVINPFDSVNHPPELFHVASGKINGDMNVNVEKAVSMGTLQLNYFCEEMSAIFHGNLLAEVKVKMTFSDKKGMQMVVAE